MDKTIRVSADLHRRAKTYAAATGQTLSELTEQAIRGAIENPIGRELRELAAKAAQIAESDAA